MNKSNRLEYTRKYARMYTTTILEFPCTYTYLLHILWQNIGKINSFSLQNISFFFVFFFSFQCFRLCVSSFCPIRGIGNILLVRYLEYFEHDVPDFQSHIHTQTRYDEVEARCMLCRYAFPLRIQI